MGLTKEDPLPLLLAQCEATKLMADMRDGTIVDLASARAVIDNAHMRLAHHVGVDPAQCGLLELVAHITGDRPLELAP